MTKESTTRYLATYSGKALLKKYTLSTEGTWVIRGEDTNCDFGGSHYMPTLGYFKGSLKDALEEFTDKRSFWSWGYGGDFELISIFSADDIKTNKEKEKEKEKELKGEKARLIARIEEIDKILT